MSGTAVTSNEGRPDTGMGMRLLVLATLLILTIGTSAGAAQAAPSSAVFESGDIGLSVTREQPNAGLPLMPGDVSRTGYVVSVSRDAQLWLIPKASAHGSLAESLIMHIDNISSGQHLFAGHVARTSVDAGLILAGHPQVIVVGVELLLSAHGAAGGREGAVSWTFMATELGANPH
jgi:hypothetical protein